MSARRRAAIVLGLSLVLPACFVDRGGGPGLDSASATQGTSGTTDDGTATATTDATTASGESPGETIASTSADPTGIDATGAVTDATTGMRGESDDPGQCADEGTSCDDASPCCGGCLSCKGGVCVADDAICGECQVCSTLGACVLAPPDTACGGVIDCAGVVWGLGGPYEDLCFAAAGGAQGRCDAGGVCAPPSGEDCEAQGELLLDCSACIKPDHNCVAGLDVGAVSLESVCVINGPSEDCGGDICHNDTYYATVVTLGCDQSGSCETIDEVDCGDYRCTYGPDQCLTQCESSADCIFAECVDGECI